MSPSASSRTRGFTLIEMLVVIGLIALIAGLAAPAFKTRSASLDAAHRQMSDDLNRARQLAISTRSTVYMVFMPILDVSVTVTNLTQAQKEILAKRQGRGYAIMSRRSVGSQPGQEEPRYLSEWKELPEGVFISTNKFESRDTGFAGYLPMDQLPRLNGVQIPTTTGTTYEGLPYIAFDSNGALTLNEEGLVRKRDGDRWRDDVEARAIIPLVAGSVLVPYTYNGRIKQYSWQRGEVSLKPPYDMPGANFRSLTNFIKRVVVDGLTGRSRVEGGEIQL